MTWVLLGTWATLMSFTVVWLVDPQWLQEVSRPGRDVEARDFKDHGDNCLRDRDYRLAIAQYTRALQIQPELAGAMANLGIAYLRLHDLGNAELWLRKALGSSNVDSGAVCYHLADLMLRRKQFDEANRYCDGARNGNYDPGAAYRRKGDACASAKRWTEARDAFEASLLHQRSVTTAYRNMLYSQLPDREADSLARLVRETDLNAYDLTLIRSLQRNDEEISRTCNDLGVAYLQLGDSARAIERVREAIMIWPGNTQALNNLKILRGLGPK